MNLLLTGTGKRRAVDRVAELRNEKADLHAENQRLAAGLIEQKARLAEAEQAAGLAASRAEEAEEKARDLQQDVTRLSRELALLAAHARRRDPAATQAMPRFEPAPKQDPKPAGRIPVVPSTIDGPHRIPLTVVPLGSAPFAAGL